MHKRQFFRQPKFEFKRLLFEPMRDGLLICLFIALCILFPGKESKASHIVGGDINYTYVGNNVYNLELHLYIDCINGGTGAIAGDPNFPVGVFDSSGNLLQLVKLVRTGPTRVIGKNFSCASPPANACVDLYVLTGSVTLPPIPGGYTLGYHRCCRNKTILNIKNPSGSRSAYISMIPDVNVVGHNSSAQFKELPPNFLCRNEPLEFDHSAIDADGDSLVYAICSPLKGPLTGSSSSTSVPPPPYFDVDWQFPYNPAYQMSGSPKLKIDPNTGLLEVTPDKLGQYVVGICVKEFRNGVLINTTMRDFQFNVEHCNFSIQSDFDVVKKKCQNTVEFVNKSSGDIVDYKWEFGIDSLTDDTSVVKNASYTFPGPGMYNVSVTAFSSGGCSRKITKPIVIMEPISGLPPDSTVCYGSKVKIGIDDITAGISYSWTPTNGLDNANISNPTAHVNGDVKYQIQKHNSTCYHEAYVNLKVDRIEADFIHEYLPPCDGLRVKYFSTSKNNTSVSWDFGDKSIFTDTSSLDSNSWFYQDSGIFYVRLDVSNGRCKDSITKPIKVYFPEIFTAVIDTVICFGDTVTIGPLNDTSILSYSWTPTQFMDDPGLLYPTVIPDSGLSYTLTKVYAHCTLKDSFVIRINELPNFGVSRTGGPDICLGDTVTLTATGDFTNKYEWFPKDNLSNPHAAITEANPSRTTLYRVKVVTAEGCRAEDTITVPLYPTYNLNLDPYYVMCVGTSFLPQILIPDSRIDFMTYELGELIDSIRDEGFYKVNVETKCQSFWDTFQVAHYQNDYCQLELPNAFSPTGDGLNDTYPFGGLYRDLFGIECLFEDYSLIIVNRWGEIVFRADDPTQEWDGRYKGNNASENVFAYFLTYREYDFCTGGSKIRVKKGNVTILH